MIHCNSTANIMIPRLTSTDTKSNGNIRLYASRRARQFKRASPITTLNKVILPEKQQVNIYGNKNKGFLTSSLDL